MFNFYHLERLKFNREAMSLICDRETLVNCVGSSSSADDFLNAEFAQVPDVVLIDMDLNEGSRQKLRDCLELAAAVQRVYPKINIVFHSPFTFTAWVDRFVRAGVCGFVSKNSGYAEIFNAFAAVAKGEVFVCPIIAAQFSNFQQFVKDNNVELKLKDSPFSPREAEVLDLVSRGRATKEIAESLFISEKTVESHRKNLMTKVGASNTAELMTIVSDRGLLFR